MGSSNGSVTSANLWQKYPIPTNVHPTAKNSSGGGRHFDERNVGKNGGGNRKNKNSQHLSGKKLDNIFLRKPVCYVTDDKK